MRRILWNKRGKDIDEIVFTNVSVHIEQMSRKCWWIGIDLPDGGHWSGNFTSSHRLNFNEQDKLDFKWDEDSEHE